MRLPTTAKVYLANRKTPVFLAEPQTADVLAAVASDWAITGTTTEGEPVAFRPGEVVSAKGLKPEPEHRAEAVAFDGRKVTVRHLPAHNRQARERGDEHDIVKVPNGQSEDDYVVIVGEDLGQAVICAVRPDTGELAEANPVVPEDAMQRYIEVARLLTEAMEIENAEYAPPFRPQDHPRTANGEKFAPVNLPDDDVRNRPGPLAH